MAWPGGPPIYVFGAEKDPVDGGVTRVGPPNGFRVGVWPVATGERGPVGPAVDGPVVCRHPTATNETADIKSVANSSLRISKHLAGGKLVGGYRMNFRRALTKTANATKEQKSLRPELCKQCGLDRKQWNDGSF